MVNENRGDNYNMSIINLFTSFKKVTRGSGPSGKKDWVYIICCLLLFIGVIAKLNVWYYSVPILVATLIFIQREETK